MAHNTRQENLDIIERQAKASGIPADDFLRFAAIETGGKFDETLSRGPRGAKGMFQFVPSTAQQYGIAGQELDAEKNTEAAARLYRDNEKLITRGHDKSGLPYLSGKPRPDGLDMYLAHQEGAGGYQQIQSALAGHALSPKMRANMMNNISGRDVKEMTGVDYKNLKGLSDQEFAKTFTGYWEKKYDRIEVTRKEGHVQVDLHNGAQGQTRSHAVDKSVSPAAKPASEQTTPASAQTTGKGITLESPVALSHKYDSDKYGFGSKDVDSGKIDCSGWVGTLVNNAMTEVNQKEQKEIFSKADRVNLKSQNAASIIHKFEKSSGVMLAGDQVTKASLKEGMIIGEDNGKQYDKNGKQWDAGNYKGIDHITMVVRDPKTGELMISQSHGGKRDNGVDLMSVDKYLAGKHAKGTHLYATDALAPVRGLLVSNDKTIEATRSVATASSKPGEKVVTTGSGEVDLTAAQKQLAALGYRGLNGYQLRGTGVNGENTIHAVKEFQEAHGLKASGVIDPKTQEALKHAKDHPLINEAGHPSHGMYEQIKEQTDKLGGAKALGFHSDKEYTQALANMTWQARTSGLTQVDHVVETANKQNLVMIQGGLTDPAQQREVANKVHAAQQPVTQSTQQLQQDVQQLQQQHHTQSQQQQATQAR